jgi:IclR family mhp operon transcriptional activator
LNVLYSCFLAFGIHAQGAELEKGVPIRSVSRALLVLQAINNAGSLSMMGAARAAGIPYPTACRVVQTLVHEGFIEGVPNTKNYQPTALAHTLSNGYKFENSLVITARPVIQELTQRILWPVSIANRVGMKMMIRASTYGMTSLAFTNFYPGDSIPLFSSASGKVHLAFCDSEERETILKGLREYGKSDDKAMAFFSAASQQGDRIRKRGFATHERNKHVDPPGKTSSISVPIFVEDAYVSTLNLIFFASAMPMKAALGKFLPELRAASRLISEKADAVAGISENAELPEASD